MIVLNQVSPIQQKRLLCQQKQVKTVGFRNVLLEGGSPQESDREQSVAWRTQKDDCDNSHPLEQEPV